VRLLRAGAPGGERPAVLGEDGTLLDPGGVAGDIDGAFLAGGVGRARAAFEAGGLPPLAGDGRVGAPPARPGRIGRIGLSYRDHAEETGAAVPDEPVVFMKAVNTMVGPDDEVRIPLRPWVNGERRQDGPTKNMIFGVEGLGRRRQVVA
jgi:2-keto-4-pentenoate hydratase/2-oxohepta-3-ene-1,7-dioic acid hydratase in catechol pathway